MPLWGSVFGGKGRRSAPPWSVGGPGSTIWRIHNITSQRSTRHMPSASATKVNDLLKIPTADALDHARDVRRRARNRHAQVRRRFVQRKTFGDPPPPMTRMLRGGQGGAVRLKLYLSILWL